MKGFKKNLLLASIVTSGTLVSCGGGDAKTNEGNKTPENKPEVVEDRTEKIENIFFNIPSPLETVNILKNAGATYEWELPLDPNLVDKYEGSVVEAMNMGIYSADLNYASVFNKTNDMYMFLACAEKLGNKLGVGQVFNKSITDRIESNVENRDSMQAIISETFWNVDATLQEENREAVSALIVAGGWLEGIYLSTQLAVLNPNNEEIKMRIAEQKYSIDNLIKLLESYNDSPELEDVRANFADLNELFKQIEEKETGLSETTSEGETPVIGKMIELNMSQELLDQITQLTSEIRVEYTQ